MSEAEIRRNIRYLQESANGLTEMSIQARNLYDGFIFITGMIDQNAADSFTSELLYMETAQEIDTINVIINSPGGSIDDGLAIYDQMQTVSKPMNVVAVSLAASMGALLLCGGPKGRRFILPHTRTMIHEPLIPQTGGSATSISKTALSILKTKDAIEEILMKHTGKTKKVIEDAIAYDHFMNAEESIEFGLCDKILKSSISSLSLGGYLYEDKEAYCFKTSCI